MNIWNNTINSDGTFTIYLGSNNLHGEAFTVTVKDQAGNVSEAISINAPLDDIAPNPIKIFYLMQMVKTLQHKQKQIVRSKF